MYLVSAHVEHYLTQLNASLQDIVPQWYQAYSHYPALIEAANRLKEGAKDGKEHMISLDCRHRHHLCRHHHQSLSYVIFTSHHQRHHHCRHRCNHRRHHHRHHHQQHHHYHYHYHKHIVVTT